MSKQALKSLNSTLKALEKSRNKEMAKIEKVVSGVNKTIDAQIKAVKDAIKTTEASTGDKPARGAAKAKAETPKRGRKAADKEDAPKAKRGAKADKSEGKAKKAKKDDAKKADRKAAVEKASKKDKKADKADKKSDKKALKADKADKKALKAKKADKKSVGGLKPKAKKGLAKSPVAAA